MMGSQSSVDTGKFEEPPRSFRQGNESLITKTFHAAGVPIVAQWLTNPTRNHEVAGSIPGVRSSVG